MLRQYRVRLTAAAFILLAACQDANAPHPALVTAAANRASAVSEPITITFGSGGEEPFNQHLDELLFSGSVDLGEFDNNPGEREGRTNLFNVFSLGRTFTLVSVDLEAEGAELIISTFTDAPVELGRFSGKGTKIINATGLTEFLILADGPAVVVDNIVIRMDVTTSIFANAEEVMVDEGSRPFAEGTFSSKDPVLLGATPGTIQSNGSRWAWSGPAMNGPASYDVTVSAANVSWPEKAYATFTVVVANVAPVVQFHALAAGAEGKLPGGFFTDPGEESWTATVDYGDGTGVSDLLLNGKRFELSHSYTKAGTFVVKVCVNDGTDSGCAEHKTVVPDKTAPVITFTGDKTYTVDRTVSITCGAEDMESPITDLKCQEASGPAYDFLGVTKLTASATNAAGLTSTATYEFTVSVTTTGLVALTTRWVTDHGIANALTKKLEQGKIADYVSQLRAQSGKKISAQHAAILIRLAQSP